MSSCTLYDCDSVRRASALVPAPRASAPFPPVAAADAGAAQDLGAARGHTPLRHSHRAPAPTLGMTRGGGHTSWMV